MEKFFEKLFDIKRIPAKLLFVLWLSSGLILFLPERTLRKLNVQQFLTDYGRFVGITFILCSAFLIVVIFTFFSRRYTRGKALQRRKIQKLRDLGYWTIMRNPCYAYIIGKSTLEIPMSNEAAISLVNKGIIYQASNTGLVYLHGPTFAYSIIDFVRENLTHEMIELPQEPGR